jgi:hypothetical protein
MKTLKFRSNLAEIIIAGKKTSTWRLFDDKDLKNGDKVEFARWETKEKFADAEIEQVREKKLREVEESDFDRHEKYESKEAMLEEFKKYYGDKVSFDTIVKIIDFKILA